MNVEPSSKNNISQMRRIANLYFHAAHTSSSPYNPPLIIYLQNKKILRLYNTPHRQKGQNSSSARTRGAHFLLFQERVESLDPVEITSEILHKIYILNVGIPLSHVGRAISAKSRHLSRSSPLKKNPAARMLTVLCAQCPFYSVLI